MPSKITNLFFGLGCLVPVSGLVLLGYFFYNRSFALGVLAVVLSGLAGLTLLGVASLKEEKQKKKQLEFLNTFLPEHSGFQKLKSYPSFDLLAKIAIDEQQKKIFLWTPDVKQGESVTKAFANMPYVIKTFTYSDILAVNLIEDNYETASVQRESHFTDFLLNKLNEEVPRALTESIDKITSMDLEIIVDDNSDPRHLIRFYHAPYIPLRKDSPDYAAYLKERDEWFTRLKTIIEQQNAVAQMEPPFGAEEPSVNTVEASEEDLVIETRHITMEVPLQEYSYHEEPIQTAEEIPEIKPAGPMPEPEEPKSYFEQLLEKNRKQLRSDPSEKE